MRALMAGCSQNSLIVMRMDKANVVYFEQVYKNSNYEALEFPAYSPYLVFISHLDLRRNSAFIAWVPLFHIVQCIFDQVLAPTNSIKVLRIPGLCHSELGILQTLTPLAPHHGSGSQPNRWFRYPSRS
ncbi:hypothetical protein EVAR_101443_1 [Eumeta japonica]|uniref:Uncharacterized protein n=1 Tax=Eumeta variegata TaxID=151549 RepID=A0A4C1TCW6_EUMVA|nr:hypothetical protein EVAR_101443_1 [Eumeta japonica]